MARRKDDDKLRRERGQALAELDRPAWQPGLEGLEWRERLFVLSYVVRDGDTLQSYAIAFGRGNGWERRALELLTKPAIVAGIDTVRRRLEAASGLSLDAIIGRLEAMADASMQRFVEVEADGSIAFDLRALADADWRAVKSLTIKGKGAAQEIRLELHDAAKALETLGRHLGMGLGTVRVIEEEKKERTRLARLLSMLTPDELERLAGVGERIEELGAVIEGEAVELEEDDDGPEG